MAEEHNLLHNISILTNRLKLREWRDDEQDYELMYKLESIPEVVRYQEWEPRTREQATGVVRTIVDSQKEVSRSHVELAVFTQEDNHNSEQFLGRVGTFINFNEQPTKSSLWFAFIPDMQGKGYATESVQALIDILRSAGVKIMEIECDPRNSGSRRLAERLGFTKVKEVERAWESKGEWVGSLEFVKTFTS